MSNRTFNPENMGPPNLQASFLISQDCFAWKGSDFGPSERDTLCNNSRKTLLMAHDIKVKLRERRSILGAPPLLNIAIRIPRPPDLRPTRRQSREWMGTLQFATMSICLRAWKKQRGNKKGKQKKKHFSRHLPHSFQGSFFPETTQNPGETASF